VLVVIDNPLAKAFRYKSLPNWRKVPALGRAAGFMTDPEWLDMMTLGFPAVWQDEIKRAHAGKYGQSEQQRREANLIVVKTARELADAQRAGLRLDATDEQIRARAKVFARHYADGIAGGQRVKTVVGRVEVRPSAGAELVGPKKSAAGTAIDAAVWSAGYSVGTEVEGPQSPAVWARREMERHGMAEHWPQLRKKCTEESALLRVKDESFWRRVLRKMFAKTIEACSIGLGLVNRARDCYVSSLSLKRRKQQNARNAASMDLTTLVNEYGQEMKLSELAEKSTASKPVRRAELMTRLSGFDLIAGDLGHEGLFLTLTCPSRMHKWRTHKGRRGGGVSMNPRYDGTTPRQAQEHLAAVWARIRSALDRRGVRLYGFRVAEPNHDGTPHWHFILFHEPAWPGDVSRRAMPRIAAIVRRYGLGRGEVDEPDHVAAAFHRAPYRYKWQADMMAAHRGEKARHLWAVAERARQNGEVGAKKHRVDFEVIDRAKGSAASYLAKYISKNIDGYGVETDLLGHPAIESSQRVDAWAGTWNIRQFQQLGGAPVTVWRELRRINTDQDMGDMPGELVQALDAVNVRDKDPEAKWAQGWAAYLRVQGGPCVRRGHQVVKLLRAETGEVNRYAEVMQADVIGVTCQGRNWHKPAHMVAMLGDLAPLVPRPAAASVESERAQWRVVGEGGALPLGEAGRPWTRVNNCTRTLVETPEGARSVSLVHRSKLGRWPTRGAIDPEPDGFPASTGVQDHESFSIRASHQ